MKKTKDVKKGTVKKSRGQLLLLAGSKITTVTEYGEVLEYILSSDTTVKLEHDARLFPTKQLKGHKMEPDYRGYSDGLAVGNEYIDRMKTHLKALMRDVNILTKKEISIRLKQIIDRAGSPASSWSVYEKQNEDWKVKEK